MPCSVSVHSAVEFPAIARQYAAILQNWKNNGPLPAHFGREGQWELNKRTVDSNIFKLHIRLPDEAGWKRHKPQLSRTSDSYLVYTRHWLDREKIQIISIMSPNAHERANTSFLAELERRAEEFQNA